MNLFRSKVLSIGIHRIMNSLHTMERFFISIVFYRMNAFLHSKVFGTAKSNTKYIGPILHRTGESAT
jgi:hypothetical protein